MITKVGVLALLGAIGIFAGEYLPLYLPEVANYYLVPIGGAIVVMAVIIDSMRE